MTSSNSSDARAALIASLALFFSILVLRIVVASSGFAHGNYIPMVGMILCGAYFFRKPIQWLVPAAAFLVSDIWITTQVYNSEFSLAYPLVVVCVYTGLVLLSRSMGTRMTRLVPALMTTVVGVLGFYLVTNSVSWLTNPAYLKTFGGWIQALTTGDPAYAATPTWMFLRANLIGSLAFTSVFVLLVHRNAKPAAEESTELAYSSDH